MSEKSEGEVEGEVEAKVDSLPGSSSACGELRAAILLVGSSGQQFCLWGASLVVILLVGSLLGRNSACGSRIVEIR